MSIQKIYRKYGKRALASILAILLSVQTPLLSYADTNDFEISSYDDVAERPVWDDSYSMDDTEEFDSSIIGAGANRIEDINDLELEPLSNEQIEYLMEHENDEIVIPQIATSNNADPLNHDDEIEPQIAVEVTVAAIACVAIMAYAGMSALSYSDGQLIADRIKKYSESSDSTTFKFDYFIGNSVKTAVFTAALAKQFLDKLNNSSGKSITLTNRDKEILAYALSHECNSTYTSISHVDPKNVNVHPVDGYKYYYILTDKVTFTSANIYVLYTTEPVAFDCYYYSSGIKNEFYFYNALLKDQTYPYSKFSYYIGTYKLSDATGLYEFSSGLRYDPSKNMFGTSNFTAMSCMPFPVFSKNSYNSEFPTFENYFTIGSPLILDLSLRMKMTNTDSLFGISSVDCSNVSDYIGSKKNTFGLTSALNPGAGLITDTGNTGTGSSTKVTLTPAQAYACIKYLLDALASNAGTAVGATSMYSFITDFYDNNIGGSASNASDMSLAIINKYVTITGGGANGTYDTKVENNKYKLAETLAVAFGKFMVDGKLISAAPDYTKNPTITNNITVAVPGTTTKPGEGTGTTTPGGGGGNTGGSTTSPDYSGSLTSIIGIITTISTAVTSIPNIFTLFQALPMTIKDSLVNAVADIPFFGRVITYLASLASAVDNIAHWQIDNWAEYSAAMLASLKSIDNIETLIGSISDFYTDNFADIIDNAVSNIPGFDTLVNTANVLKVWNIDTVGETIVTSINNALAKLGLATIPDKITSFKESVDSKFIESAALLAAIKDALGSLSLGVDLSGLSDTIKNALTALGLASLLGKVAEIGEAVKSISFADIIAAIKALPASIAAEIAKVIPSQEKSDNENQNDSGFKNFLNLFMVAILILIILIVLFINCLRFIVLVFNIPASTTLLPDDVLTGIQYLKDLQLPMFGVSLYTLLLSCAYFIIFMTVIMTLRRKIDKIHI